jgi:hypothetical protein
MVSAPTLCELLVSITRRAGKNSLMLRTLAISLLLLPCLIAAQDQSKQQKDRTRVLDTAAKTPFFTQRGADSVKKVIAGGQVRKDDETVLDPVDPKTPPSRPLAPGQKAPQKGLPSPAPAPVPEPVFAWRLIGISYGKHHGVALFQSAERSRTASPGTSLDVETKVLSVDKSHVVLMFHGKRLDLIPW